MTRQESDKLIDGCSRNDRHAQNLLFQTYGRKVLAICMRYASCLDEAKDLQQETFIKIFQTLISKTPEVQSLDSWIARIAINVSIDHFRALRRIDEARQQLPPIAVDVSPAILDQLSEEDLTKIIQRIPNPYRLVFNLYIIEGMSHKEIGEQLGMTESTSRSYLTRAKEFLRKMIQPETDLRKEQHGRVW